MIKTVEEGPELDKLIHEKVFGRTDTPQKYSTDSSLADEVVEFLRDKRRFWYRLELNHPRGQPDKKEWTCTITDSMTLRKLSDVTRESRPYAICLAALEAVTTFNAAVAPGRES